MDGVLARSRDERQKSLDELERREHNRRRAVGKWPLEAQHDASVGELGDPVRGDGRPSQVPRQMLQSITIVSRNAHRGVHTESTTTHRRPVRSARLGKIPDPMRAGRAPRRIPVAPTCATEAPDSVDAVDHQRVKMNV
jgi:hypothetical protein